MNKTGLKLAVEMANMVLARDLEKRLQNDMAEKGIKTCVRIEITVLDIDEKKVMEAMKGRAEAVKDTLQGQGNGIFIREEDLK